MPSYITVQLLYTHITQTMVVASLLEVNYSFPLQISVGGIIMLRDTLEEPEDLIEPLNGKI